MPVDLEHLRHNFSASSCSDVHLQLKRNLVELGFTVSSVRKSPQELKGKDYPVIAQFQKSGDFALLLQDNREERKILVQRSSGERASWIAVDELKGQLQPDLFIAKIKKETAEESSSRFSLSWFIEAALRYKSILRDCILASLFVQIFGLLAPLFFMIVIDKVLSNNSLSTLDVLVFALVVVSAFEILLGGLRSYLMSHTANRIDLKLGITLFRHLISLPMSYFESRQVGDTIARMRELETVRQFITGSGIMLFLDLFFLVIFLVVMYLFSPFLATIVVAALPFLFCASFFITPFLRNSLEDRYGSNAANQSFLVETISGMETIKSSAAEPKIRAKWEEKLAAHVQNGFHSGNLSNLIQQSTTIVSKILSVLLLWLGAKEVLHGNLTIGQLIAFNMLSSRAVAPILRLSQVWKEFQQAKVSVARIGDIFNCPPEPGFDPARVSLPPLRGKVEFDRVSFRYRPDSPLVLEEVNFSVNSGEVTGIVGSTGSGKTTLAKLLLRLYVPERGKVLVDGINLAMADTSWLRRQIGVVVQDGVLFNSSIRDNIALNSPELDIEDVMKVAELAGAHEFILQLPDGYDTLVGERGLQLSTGQRQRLAIARALATDPKMLVLDEATSALDYESERIIQNNMQEICKGRTVFIVAHRLSTVRQADRIITLEKGRIVENDSPQALLAAGGRYATLHAIQEGTHG
ncbi:ATP-binding cassette, subfamily B, HlyB/CyaB [Desulforhopalus singaporensis]|uniref:ATP-binding cassette, subfamily B, HlyB/CyaB n=2 Tax=Desulforhopalus singaporensis TaxID=91360 RepID=A0A1H0RYZ1_9BACT|nr:ATP-binding cassette, subfamily B, HlyB/CyaB [Desulforhopalus singaporensis]